MSRKTGWDRAARQVAPEEWARMVGMIPAPAVRARVAAIVWWDMLADRAGGPSLEAMFAGAEDAMVDPSMVAAGLASVGYPADVAEERSSDRGRQVVLSEGDPDDAYSRCAVGERGLACAIYQQAFYDVQTLVRRGVVLPDGSVRAGWPPRNHNGVVGYVGRAEVQALMDWVLDGDFEAHLEGIGNNRDFSKCLKMMGLKVGQEKAEPDREVA